MKKMAKIALWSLIASVALFAGCEKKVNLTFVNASDQSLDLVLTSPDQGTEHLGVLTPTGGKLKHTLKIDPDLLPAICTWQAGDASKQFTITKHTPAELWIDVPEGVARDKKTKINRTQKSEEKRAVSEETVVQ